MLLAQSEQQYLAEKLWIKSTQLDFRHSRTDVGHESKITVFKKHNESSRTKTPTNMKVHTKHETHELAYNSRSCNR